MPTKKYDMLVNVPVTVEIKYVDVWPGEKYGPQVSVKGEIEGETKVIYLSGKPWANLKGLKEGGVIGEYDKSAEEPEEKTAIPVNKIGPVVLTRVQKKGERFANLVVTSPDGPAKPAPAAAAASPGPAPKKPADQEQGPKLYAKITDWVIGEILPKYAEAGIPVTHEGTAAIIATLFISKTKH